MVFLTSEAILNKGLTWKWNKKPLKQKKLSSSNGNVTPHIARLLENWIIIPSIDSRFFKQTVFAS